MISFVVPCYNEEGNIREFCNQARDIMMGLDYEIIFINDGSKDHTIDVLKEVYGEKNEKISIVNFSRNFGKESAMYAGFTKAKGDYVIVIDADLQQPIETAREMVEFLEENEEYDEVAAYQIQRKEGKILEFFKGTFYKIINKLCDVELYRNASDFRCFRKKVVDTIIDMPEFFRFSKGIFAWVGYNTYYRPYEVKERYSGTTSWSFFKLMGYAIEGIVSFSTKPLKIATSVGLFTSFAAVIYMVVVILQKLIFGIDVPGYPTLVTLILFIGGIQLIVLGIIGEYLARIHIEVKKRPIFIEKEFLTYEK